LPSLFITILYKVTKSEYFCCPDSKQKPLIERLIDTCLPRETTLTLFRSPGNGFPASTHSLVFLPLPHSLFPISGLQATQREAQNRRTHQDLSRPGHGKPLL
ncbi:hypothetical protein F2P56_032340, partial [Juglans regia]